MAESPNRRIWDNAVPLGDAWRQFADPAKQTKLAEQRDGISAFNAFASTVDNPNLAALWKVATEAIQSGEAKRSFENDMQEDLLDELFNANLLAVGYRTLPSISSAPVMIAPDFFEFSEIGWLENTAEYEGKRYIRVRVFDPNADDASPRRQMGRPSSRAAISAAITELINDPNIAFCNLPRKTACDLIRAKLGHDKISGSGLSNENLSKYILERCPTRELNN